MQQKNEKTLHLAAELGSLIKELRETKSSYSLDSFANSYGLSKGTLSLLENGKTNCKFVTIWTISEAIGMKCSDLIKILEDKLGDDFKLIDD